MGRIRRGGGRVTQLTKEENESNGEERKILDEGNIVLIKQSGKVNVEEKRKKGKRAQERIG